MSGGEITRVFAAAFAAVVLGVLGGCRPSGVDADRLARSAADGRDWLITGRTYDEQRYSPLAQIDVAKAGRLGLAWEASLESNDFGVEATPVEADGVLYVTSTWSRVYAFDAKTGRRLWSYDPQVPPDWLRQACCKAVNRGVALWDGKVFVGALDGRLIALDAHTGKPVWIADTTGHAPNYTITGAPRVIRGKVLIGNGGADLNTRGFLSAYDAATGKLAWRFYVVPRDPRLGQETPELTRAAASWDPRRDWSKGGGGGPWDSMSYDPQLNLLYVGTGNAAPAKGQGDGQWVCSIVAIDPDTGRMVWAYQTTPGDRWDFDAVQNLVLADLTIAGAPRKVLMQASKNGFFYVLDRATGQLLSADKYVRVNWADHVDLKTGRPVEAAVDPGRRSVVLPSMYGAHNWQPMAFSPKTGLVYIPAQDMGWVLDPKVATFFTMDPNGASLAPEEAARRDPGQLIAWDPKTGRAAWTAPLGEPMNGGVLATAGGLVVQGTADGRLQVRDAATGRLLREILVGTGIAAAPSTYEVDGVQYLAVTAGWNGVHAMPESAGQPRPYDNAGRLIVLKLDGGAVPTAPRLPAPPPFLAGVGPQPAELASRGHALYLGHCARCHGWAGERTPFPDLRRMSTEVYQAFDEIVLDGAYRSAGMASFADVLTPADAQAIRAFLADWAMRSAGGRGPAPAVAPKRATGQPRT